MLRAQILLELWKLYTNARVVTFIMCDQYYPTNASYSGRIAYKQAPSCPGQRTERSMPLATALALVGSSSMDRFAADQLGSKLVEKKEPAYAEKLSGYPSDWALWNTLTACNMNWQSKDHKSLVVVGNNDCFVRGRAEAMKTVSILDIRLLGKICLFKKKESTSQFRK